MSRFINKSLEESENLPGTGLDVRRAPAGWAPRGAHPFKTDLDIERLPPGKFATHDLIMNLAAYSYNILRWIDPIGLLGDISPVRHPAKRRRLRTVIQEPMYRAPRVIRSVQWTLRFSVHGPPYQAFRLTDQHLAHG